MKSPSLVIDVQFARSEFDLRVQCEVPPGVTVLFGPSGAGKSTLLGLVAGLLRPTRGRIAVGSEAWFDANTRLDVPTRARRVGYLFQSLALFPHRTAWQNVTFSPRASESSARALLERLGIAALRDRNVSALSGGERQRVALARALASDPTVLLLDEPLSALDRARRGESIALLRSLVRERGIPALYVTHDYEEAEAVGDGLLQIERGAIVRSGVPADVLEETLSWSAAAIGQHDNHIHGVILGAGGDDEETVFRAGNVTLHARPVPLAEGTEAEFAVRAADITLSLEPLGRTSAGNVLAGVVSAIATRGRAVIVTVDVGITLRAEVTPAAARRLALTTGLRTWVAFKTRACHVRARLSSDKLPTATISAK